MSTVALKGILQYDKKAKQWTWNGRWVFGDSVPPENKNNKSHKKRIMAQPFHYKWEEPIDPSKILVPPSIVQIDVGGGGAGVEIEQEVTTTTTQSQQSSTVSAPTTNTAVTEKNQKQEPYDEIIQNKTIPKQFISNTEGTRCTDTAKAIEGTSTIKRTATTQMDSALTDQQNHLPLLPQDVVMAQPVGSIQSCNKEKIEIKKQNEEDVFHLSSDKKNNSGSKINYKKETDNNKNNTEINDVEMKGPVSTETAKTTAAAAEEVVIAAVTTTSTPISIVEKKQLNDDIATDTNFETKMGENGKKSASSKVVKSDKIIEFTRALKCSTTENDDNYKMKKTREINTVVVTDKKTGDIASSSTPITNEKIVHQQPKINNNKVITSSTSKISTETIIAEKFQIKKKIIPTTSKTSARMATATLAIDDEESKIQSTKSAATSCRTNIDTHSTSPPVTFSSLMPSFTEASIKYTSNYQNQKGINDSNNNNNNNSDDDNQNNKNHNDPRCPPSGLWSGYFENSVIKKAGRKALQPQKNNETFYLFLNATPSDPTTSKDNNGGSNIDGDDENAKKDGKNKNDNNHEYKSFKRFFAFETATKNHIPKIVVAPPKDKPGAPSYTSAESSLPLSPSSTLPGYNPRPTITSMISLVQVRGCGENQFGTFEIIGYLDLNTMVMEIQRQYVIIEIPTNVLSLDCKKRRTLPSSVAVIEGPRPQSTRKRQPTWKRKSYDPEDDRRKKRSKSSQQQQIEQIEGKLIEGSQNDPTIVTDRNIILTHGTGVDPLTLKATFNESMSSVLVASGEPTPLLGSTSTSENGTSIQLVKTSLGKVSKSNIVLLTQPNTTMSTKKQATSSGGGVARAKKRSSTSSKSAGLLLKASSKSSCSSSTYICLPPVQDPKKARWRAAHFLYYQRDNPDLVQQQQQQTNGNSTGGNSVNANAAATNTNNKVTPPKPRYVIYEGEMVDSKREGRGICLYNNGMLYEGEWKRNKEHGYGKLMTSDRKKIVYEGEWERGKIAGTGAYYFGSSDPLQPDSRYIGEFRENLRNGMGRYFLPDGSVYDGQWRDGTMNGLGIFTWSDGSIYDGVWKDGKRNGQGLLRNIDGFIYDGQWVNNSMEGRGSAIYPNGQRYEGSFSNGRREGRGTIHFTNGAVYEGRFRDDAVDGQGTMKMSRAMVIPREERSGLNDNTTDDDVVQKKKEDFMIPVSFQSDMTRILTRTGFM